MEELVEKIDEMYTEEIRITGVRTKEFVGISNIRSHYQDLIKLYRHSKDCRNKASLVLSTSAVDKDPNETVIDAQNRAIENAEKNVEVSSRRFAAQGSRQQPGIGNSRSSRRRQIDVMELENLRAKKETEQRLRERLLELEKEREEIELCRQKEKSRLQQHQREQVLQQQEDELRLRQHERELENERKKAEAEKEQGCMKN